MEEENKDLENKINEAKYQLRVEIAERCFNQNASIDFVAKACSFTHDETVIIYCSLKRRKFFFNKQEKDKKNQEIYKKPRRRTSKEKNTLIEEQNQIELKQTIQYKREKQRDIDLQREIAAEKTRVLLEKIRDEQKIEVERKKREQEAEIFRRKELRLKIEKEKPIVKTSKKEALDAPNELNKEQKMIASVGQCYLRGLSVKQAILFSKASPEQVEQIYNSFKNK